MAMVVPKMVVLTYVSYIYVRLRTPTPKTALLQDSVPPFFSVPENLYGESFPVLSVQIFPLFFPFPTNDGRNPVPPQIYKIL